MTTRIRQETVTFQNNFSLSGFDRIQPPGRYVVEIEEELITELSFAAFRRIATVIRLPSSQLGGYQVETIDLLELDVALKRDAALGSSSMAQSDHQSQREAEPEALSRSGSSAFFSFSERFRRAVSRLGLMDQLGS
jgi:hypothetical protein